MRGYRIKPRLFGWEPQQRYWTIAGDKWIPLDRMGFWHQPDAYSTGVVKPGLKMRRADALTAIARAKAINGPGIVSAVGGAP